MSVGWEFNVNLGTIVPLVFAAGIFYAITKNDIKTLKDSIVKIDHAMERQTETIQQISVQKSQLQNQADQIASLSKLLQLQEQRLYDLSRGHGFVQERRPQGVDGEYP